MEDSHDQYMNENGTTSKFSRTFVDADSYNNFSVPQGQGRERERARKEPPTQQDFLEQVFIHWRSTKNGWS
jgi:hypothetical protein